MTTRDLEDGIAILPVDERARLVSRARSEAPVVWQRAGSGAERAFLAGAVAAALAERCEPPELGLALLDEGREPGETDADVLALALDTTHLWSVREALAVGAALAALDDDLSDEAYDRAWHAIVERETARLASDEHRARLARMVARLEARLPVPDRPTASQELRAACAAFASSRRVRDELTALLLADAACLVARHAPAVAA